MTTTYRIETRDGRIVERRSEARYVAASVTEAGRVRFHSSHEAARSAAGRFGYVVAIEAPAAATKAADVWIVTYADGETREVEVSARKSPVSAGREARPDVAIVGARAKR